ncbi:uncharacterized protein LOC111710525 [Eurytemora carolleeae]|uniref:uncharacterized protein LOC111710525 n=1 Tax=Eurytemora carolleeae TaxID=1294199 RepID=UPI000C7699A1|nr:uncharacterized protein LOC111710525 [Eurytemora carolleeae]|eukprot:XP_023340394.1 uncharacterized protein LOC111710525 [Eurytemora affinis]
MGASNSKPDKVPVLGSAEENPLSIIPVFRTSLRESYTVSKKTVLKLKPNSILSVESNIVDTRGFYVFRKTGSFLSCCLEFSDDAGNVLATVENKIRCLETTAWIKLGDSSGDVVATLVHHYRGKNSKVFIYIHQDPLPLEETECSRRNPNIKVVGDIGSHQFYFKMADKKIAQVQRSTENQMYSLEVGPNTDIAFITICTAAIDLIHLRSSLTPLDLCCCFFGSEFIDEEPEDEETD